MKIFFANSRSGAGISIRAAINALLNWHKAERTQTAARKKNLPQITPEWNYRPKEKPRMFAAIGSAGRESIEFTTPEPFAINNHSWFPEDSCINAEIPSSL
jgi:hypothetical protein